MTAATETQERPHDLPPDIGDDNTVPHAECVEAVRAYLHDRADQHMANYLRLDREPRTRGNGRVQRRMAAAFGWTRGELRALVRR